MLNIHSKRIKKIAITIGVLVLFYFGLNWLAQKKALSLLDESLPDHVELNYEQLKVNIVTRSAWFKKVSLSVIDSITKEEIGNIKIEELQAKQFGLLDYLFNETLSLHYVGVSKGEGYLKIDKSKAKDSIKLFSKLPLNGAQFDDIKLEHLAFKLINAKNDSLIAKIKDLNLEVSDLKGSRVQDDLKLSYDSYTISTDSISVHLEPLNTLTISSINGSESETTIANISFKTKYDIKTFSQYIQHERDYYDININTIKASKLNKTYDFNKNYIGIEGLKIDQPNVFIYRDRTRRDDHQIKPMMSEIIRNISINFNIEKLSINSAQLTYKERRHLDNEGGILKIDNVMVDVENLSNLAKYQPIAMNISANYDMTTTMKAEWDFDVLNENDEFVFSSEVKNIDLSSLNGFSKPTFNSEMEGQINELYYTISGDQYRSVIDIRSKHDNVKVTIFKKNHKNRNKFFSSIANLMISNNSESRKSDFITKHKEVERDRSKSVFNFLAKNVREGMMKVFL